MKKKNYFTIGEIAKISSIPIKTLRFYDKIGLLKPDFIDPETKYRFYSNDQLFLISIIKELKLFEFSLTDIKEFLERNNLRKIVTLYRKKKNEIEKTIDHLSKIKQRIENRFEAFEDMFRIYENQKPDLENYYIELKNIPERPIVSKRFKSAFNLENFALRCIELHNIIEANNLYIKGPFMAIFHEDFEKIDLNNADVEACGPVYPEKDLKISSLRTLPAGLYATTICKGPHLKTLPAYLYMKEWLMKKNYKMIGPVIKIYILNVKLINSPDDFISEIQILVDKN